MASRVSRRAFTVEPDLVCCAFPLPCRPSKAADGWVGSWWVVGTERNQLVPTESLGDSRGGDENRHNKGGKTQLDLGNNVGKGTCAVGAS